MKLAGSVFLMLLLLQCSVHGFDLNAHDTLSRRAVTLSGLNGFLQGVLSSEFPDGINQNVVGTTKVIDLIAEGSVNEDRPFFRTRHHFHNPTLTWDQAGWTPPLLGQLGASSILWSQDPDQGFGGKHSWHDARNSYFQALTATSQSEGYRLFAETFRSLGHLVHLVQDAATPSHSRNDSHINFRGIGDPDRFHTWGDQAQGLASIAGSISQPVDQSILNTASNPLAPIPIARIIDATDGDRGTPEAGNNIGIAEYSNANFFSDDTLFKDFPFPTAGTNPDLREEDAPDGSGKRVYLYKNPPGDSGYRLAVASRLSSYVNLPVNSRQWELDDKVMQDYGNKLLPRAIGYSAGLIDYFFRGWMDFSPGPCCEIFASPPSHFAVQAANWTPNEETGAGSMVAVLTLACFEGPCPPAPPGPLVSAPTALNLGREYQEIVFHFPGGLPFPEHPVNTVVYNVLMVYKGPLGKEEAAVVVSSACSGISLIHGEGYWWTWGEC
jgi:hypothetical protein